MTGNSLSLMASVTFVMARWLASAKTTFAWASRFEASRRPSASRIAAAFSPSAGHVGPGNGLLHGLGGVNVLDFDRFKSLPAPGGRQVRNVSCSFVGFVAKNKIR